MSPESWLGKFTFATKWDHGATGPRDFKVELSINRSKIDSNGFMLVDGTPGIAAGQKFKVYNGRRNLQTGVVFFDMIFDDDHIPEHFTGTVTSDKKTGTVKLHGTIKVKKSWLEGKPAMVHRLYGEYYANVILHSK